jgi:polysaccharide biosynthesis/export protein
MRRLITSVLLLGATALACFAQKESLLIGPGDLIYVEVFDTPEMAQEARVSDAGTVRLTFIGEMKVAGETPAAASKAIESALIDKKVMLHPQVKIRVEEYATQDVSVLGQVQTPGTFPITTAQPVLKILSLAGGLTGGADRNVTIERHGDVAQKVKYYLSNDADAALANSVLVYPGDTVIVPRAPIVYIMGDVAHPGGYPINTNDSKLTVLEAVAMAGSVNKTAAQSHVRLIRKTGQGQQDVDVQLADIQKGKHPDITMQSDDILYVPFSWMKNMAVSASAIAASTSSAAIYAVK